MKRFLYFLFILILTISFVSCDILNKDDDEPAKPETLYVKYTNDSESVATITSISIQAMGNAGEVTGTPQGDWSSDILKAGEKIAPGGHVFLTLEIPNLHYVRCRIAIDDGKGGETWLHELNGDNYNYPSITHWGGDDRSCYAQISLHHESNKYYIQGWGDWVGID